MTRAATRRAFLATVAMTLAGAKVATGQAGTLTCDLTQWSHVTFLYKGKRVVVPTEELFEALQG